MKIGEGEHLELRDADIVTEEIRANCGHGSRNYRQCDVNEKGGRCSRYRYGVSR